MTNMLHPIIQEENFTLHNLAQKTRNLRFITSAKKVGVVQQKISKHYFRPLLLNNDFRSVKGYMEKFSGLFKSGGKSDRSSKGRK